MEDIKELIAAFVCPLIGAWALHSSIKNKNSFFESFKASIIIAVITRTGARIFYGILGVVLIVLGFKIMFDMFTR